MEYWVFICLRKRLRSHSMIPPFQYSNITFHPISVSPHHRIYVLDLPIPPSPYLSFISPHLFFVLPDLNGHVRTDLSADRTTRAGAVVVPDDIEVSLTVDLLSDSDQLLRTGNGAECAPFTSLFVNLDFRWHSSPIKIPITKF